jgi:hypothetical protein
MYKCILVYIHTCIHTISGNLCSSCLSAPHYAHVHTYIVYLFEVLRMKFCSLYILIHTYVHACAFHTCIDFGRLRNLLCMYAYAYIHTYIHKHTCICICMYVYVYIYMLPYTHTLRPTFKCSYQAPLQSRVNLRTNIDTLTCTYISISYMHTL